MSSPSIQPIVVSKGFIAAAALSILASIILSTVHFIYVPLAVDGTWYSYPAYAWSQGGDPSENIPDVGRPSPAPEREFATFGWENRSNLTVLMTDGWFKAFNPSWVSLKAFGAVQLIVLAVLMGIVVRSLTESSMLGWFAACLLLADSRAITEAISDARPDLFIAVVAMGLLLLLVNAYKSLEIKPVIGAAALAVVLPLLHVTAANAIAFFLIALIGCAVIGRNLEGANQRLRIGALIATVLIITFFLKQKIIDLLIPTHVPLRFEDPFRHHMADEFAQLLAKGAVAKLKIEWLRWTRYFFRANMVHFVFMIVALIFATRLARQRRLNLLTVVTLSLILGFFGAMLSMLLTDSHEMTEHALVAAVLGYVGFVAALGAAERASILGSVPLVRICCLTLVCGAVFTSASALSLYRQYAGVHFSNAAEEAILLNALPQHGDVKIIGPTEIWPYLVKRHEPLLLEDKRELFRDHDFGAINDGQFAGASYVIINKGYYDTWRWKEAVAQWTNQGLISGSKQLGDCDRVQCLRIYSFASPTGSGAAVGGPK